MADTVVFLHSNGHLPNITHVEGFRRFLLVNARIIPYYGPKLFSLKFFLFHLIADKVLEFSFSQSGVCYPRKYSDTFFQRLLTMLTANTFLV
jgi:hypothetical protein